MSRPYSLRRRLVWLLTGSVAAIWLLSALVVYQRAHHEADELLDAQLTQVADTLLAIVAGGGVEHVVEELDDHARHHPVPIAFEVWHGKHGQMQRLVTSMGHGGFESGVVPGFSEHLYQGALWRFYAVQDADEEYQVVVGQAHAARETLAREIGGECEVVLLGSIATPKYVDVLLSIFGERLVFPIDFVGRGDMSRGGLMLRCARAGLDKIRDQLK